MLAASEKAGETLVYGNGYSVSLWDGAVAVERNGDFVRILCGKEKILLWPEGAEAETLPEDWKDCTILLMEELPDTFRELDPVYGIFCMDEESVSHVWRADYTLDVYKRQNQEILKGVEVSSREMPIEEARKPVSYTHMMALRWSSCPEVCPAHCISKTLRLSVPPWKPPQRMASGLPLFAPPPLFSDTSVC